MHARSLSMLHIFLAVVQNPFISELSTRHRPEQQSRRETEYACSTEEPSKMQ